MFGFSSMPSSSTRCAISASNTACSVSVVTVEQRSIEWSPSISTSGSTIGTMPLFLAQRGVARERVRVHVDAVLRRDAVADVDHRAPLGEPRAELAVLDEPRAQAVEAVGDELARRDFASGVVPLSTLMPGMMPGVLEHLHERAAVGRPAGGSSRRTG